MNYAISYPRAWRIFFGLWSALWLLAVADELTFGTGRVGFNVLAMLGLFLLSAVPLHGYVWQKTYRPMWLWRICLWVWVLSAVSTLLSGGEALANRELGQLLVAAVFSVSTLVYAFALNQYIRCSAHLWRRDLTHPSSGQPSAAAHIER